MLENRSDDPILGELENAVGELPIRQQRRLRPLLSRLQHWLHLRKNLLCSAESAVGDLRIENAALRWDLQIQRSSDFDRV